MSVGWSVKKQKKTNRAMLAYISFSYYINYNYASGERGTPVLVEEEDQNSFAGQGAEEIVRCEK